MRDEHGSASIAVALDKLLKRYSVNIINIQERELQIREMTELYL